MIARSYVCPNERNNLTYGRICRLNVQHARHGQKIDMGRMTQQRLTDVRCLPGHARLAGLQSEVGNLADVLPASLVTR
jgi:hypothetical protein